MHRPKDPRDCAIFWANTGAQASVSPATSVSPTKIGEISPEKTREGQGEGPSEEFFNTEKKVLAHQKVLAQRHWANTAGLKSPHSPFGPCSR